MLFDRQEVQTYKGNSARQGPARLLQQTDEATPSLGLIHLRLNEVQMGQAFPENRTVYIQTNGEDLLGDLIGDAENFVVIGGGLESHFVVQHGATVVTHIHGGIYGQQEKANPINITAPQQMRVGTHDQCKRFAMAKLVIAPTLKPTKDRMKTLVRISFQLAKNGDVACVSDFF